jgi:hypothetical protein
MLEKATFKPIVNSSKVTEWILWTFVIVGLFVRIITIWQHNPINQLWSDPGRHWQNAIEAIDPSPMSAIDPLTYQLWLGFVAKLSLGNPVLVFLFSSFLSILTPFAWYLFLKELLQNKLLALLGFVVLTWLPSWIGIFSYFMNETLLLPLLGLTLYATLKTSKTPSTKSLLIVTFLWLLTCLTRPVVIPLAFLSVTYLIYKQNHKIKNLVLVLILTIATLLIPAYRTYQLIGVISPFGYPMLNRIYFQSGKKKVEFEIATLKGNVYSYEYSSPSLYFHPFEPFSAWQAQRKGTVFFQIDSSKGNADWLNALQKNSLQGKQLAAIYFENAISLLFDRTWPDCNQNHFWERLSQSTRWLWAPLLLIVTLINLLVIFKKRTISFISALTILAWLTCFTSPYGVIEGRYRKPLEGLLIANALWLIAENKKKQLKQNTPKESFNFKLLCIA